MLFLDEGWGETRATCLAMTSRNKVNMRPRTPSLGSMAARYV